MVEDGKSAQSTFEDKVGLLVNIYANLTQQNKLPFQSKGIKNGSFDVYKQIIDLTAETITKTDKLERSSILTIAMVTMDRRHLFNITTTREDFVQKALLRAFEIAESRSPTISQE